MRRLVYSVVIMAGLTGCDQAEASRKSIEAQCLASGDTPEVCTCLARESVERLDGGLIDIVVLGAKGETAAASEMVEALEGPAKVKFTTEIPAIMAECGAGG